MTGNGRSLEASASALRRAAAGFDAPGVLALLTFGLFVSQAAASDAAWIERRWISDGDLSAAANPHAERLAPADLARFKSLFGKTIWEFEDGVFTGMQTESGYQGSSPYYVRPAGAGRWEIIYYHESQESAVTVWEVEGGFCADTVPGWVKESRQWSEPGIIECYVPDDT